jgi:site-specific DNA recombinase
MQDAVIYTRVSSREQQQEGFSLGAQSKCLREYADRSGFQIVKAFEDVETAKASGRVQFSEMMAWFKHNRSCRVLLVEKTDRLYRNLRDAVTLEDLDIETHLVKEGQIISKDAKSQAKLIHGIHLVMAKNYSENLREEVKKGMREKASQGVYPGHAPFGYRNNKAERSIEVDPVDSPIVKRLFELYATGAHSLTTVTKAIHRETGRRMSRNNVHLILKNRFYVGCFEWSGQTWTGSHPLFLNPLTFEEVQSVLASHNRPKYSKNDIAFRGLMTCAYDNCMVTGEVQKGKYRYYHCTGHRGKCGLPWFREEEIAARLGEPLKHLQVLPEAVSKIVFTLREDQKRSAGEVSVERTRLEARLTGIRSRMDAAYVDKLDRKIPEDFWERKMSEWRMEEQQVKMAIQGLSGAVTGDRALDAQRIFELANKAYSLYISQNPVEKAKLLRMLFSNCSVDAVSVYPTYRKPFDMIVKRARLEEWSGREDSNLRPPGPEPGALPDCATPRTLRNECRWRVRSVLLRGLV